MSSQGGQDQALLQQRQQQDISKATGKINAAFSVFDPKFYAQANKTFLNQLMPAVQQNAQQEERSLGFNLAGRGLTQSSAAQQLGQSLAKETNNAQMDTVNKAQSMTNQLKTGMAQKQAGLIGEAGTAASPAGVAQKALNDASGFQSPGWFQGVGEAIGGWADSFLTQKNKQNWASIPAPSAPNSLGLGSSFMSYQPASNQGYDLPTNMPSLSSMS